MADRISSCPDSILCYILSFLPTKQVVATRFLSKRWKHLWRSVPSLDFDFRNCFFASPLFSVYYLLNFREIYQPLHRLRFTCSNFFDFDGVDRCFETALRRSGRLEHLDINLEWTVYLPFAVFFCQTLVVLKLAIITPNFFPFVDLPLLKILHLKSARFFKCEDLQRFLSGCPNIEDLEVGSGLTRKPAANSAVKFQKLPKLIRANIHTHLIPLEFVKNVEVLVTDRIYKDDLVFDLHNLLQLELTRFNLSTKWFEVFELLKHCPKLKALVIDIYEKKKLVAEGDEKALLPCPDPVPTCISLHLKTCRLNRFKGSVVHLQFAEYIMKNANYLRTMKFRYASNSLRRHDLTCHISSCMKSSDTCTLSFE